jgi:hypothetical protein
MLCGIFAIETARRRKIILPFLLITIFAAAAIISAEAFQAPAENAPGIAASRETLKQLDKAMNYNIRRFNTPEKAGITAAELDLIKGWCFLTENMGAKLLSEINESVESKKTPADFLINAAKKFFAIAASPLFFTPYLAFLLMGRFILPLSARTSEGGRPPVYNAAPVRPKIYRTIKRFVIKNPIFAFIFIIFHCFIAYLCFKGRFPPRVFHLLAILAGPPAIILFCNALGDFMKAPDRAVTLNMGRLPPLRISRFRLIASSLAIFAAAGALSLACDGLKYGSRAKEAALSAVEGYAIANPQNLYVYDISLINKMIPSPLNVYRDKKPTNLMFWGGWDAFTPAWRERLRRNGISELDCRSFLGGRVFLMSEGGSAPFSAFAEYMGELFPKDAGYSVIDTFDAAGTAVSVYKFGNAR